MERQLSRFRAITPDAETAAVPAAAPVADEPVAAKPEPAAVAPEPAAAPAAAAVAAAAHVPAKKHRTPKPPKPAKMVKRASKTPVAQKSPTARKRRGARIFTLVAMLFIAGIALATSIPAAALLTPEQVAMQNEQARMKYAAFVGDGQSIGGGGGAQAAAGRDGVNLGSSSSMPLVGAYSDKRLKVTVPVSNNPIKWPFPSAVHVTDTFGWRYLFGYSNFHTGLDFDLPYGTDIRAVADGIVTLVEDPGPMCGASITIEHNVGGNKFTSVYCHMITHSTSLKAGDTVSVGDKVGQIGLTGITTGAHLHLEIRLSDIPVDPYAFLKQAAGNPPV
jgi:murein DD-endopeptidase MepM/ murein hydrolase activator NlpD